MKEKFIEILTITGFFIALYSLYVEKKLQKNSNYKPLCDISDKLSCQKAARSPYAHLLFFSNSFIAAFFYGVFFCFTMATLILITKLLSLAAFIISIGMAYILFFKIKTACPLCISLYITKLLSPNKKWFGFIVKNSG